MPNLDCFVLPDARPHPARAHFWLRMQQARVSGLCDLWCLYPPLLSLLLTPCHDTLSMHLLYVNKLLCLPLVLWTKPLQPFVCAGRCLERACCAAAAAWLMLYTPTTAFAAPEALPYQEADQTPETQRAKTAPLSQDKQSAATDSSSQLPPLPTSFPLLPDIVVQAPQEVSSVLDCLPHANCQ